ncbi:MAG TPA: hypothetical protein VND41_02470 [Nitrososphaerales archaeon]|nr:hypothetical protein [Nitrososphaerales archaeon]
MKLYGSDAERREVSLIQRRFVGCEVVDPSAHQTSAEPGRETEYYLSLVDSCDCLVFSRLFGYVTEGVKPEIDRALSKEKPVYELRDGRFIPVAGPVFNLPMMERLVLRAKGALGFGRKSQ